LVTEAHRCK